MTGRNIVTAMNTKKMPAPMNAAKYVNCVADGMLRSKHTCNCSCNRILGTS